jgi:nucleotide-binding universal stress UspA family protein
MYSTILVPLDGSKRAKRSCLTLKPLAKCTQARLILLNVVEPVHMLVPWLQSIWWRLRWKRTPFTEP